VCLTDGGVDFGSFPIQARWREEQISGMIQSLIPFLHLSFSVERPSAAYLLIQPLLLPPTFLLRKEKQHFNAELIPKFLTQINPFQPENLPNFL
jgi:hypothetical protein